ncbi:O-antigen ligase family protein [Monaibacterium marinum]|nr:O-antigen ligase family protein [Monaibacterium marinum]
MLDPDRAMLLGLTGFAIMILPLAMLALWPEVRSGLFPHGSLAKICGLVFGLAALLAFTRAPHTGFSLLALQFWIGALIAGRAVQLVIRAHGVQLGDAALLAILMAGPLYVLLLPLMDIIYSESRSIDWSRDMPGFNHVRKMGHLLTASAAVGLITICIPNPNRSPKGDIALTVLGTLAIAFMIWSGARGAWLALLAGGGLTLFIAQLALQPRRSFRLVIALIAAIILAMLLPSPGPNLGFLDELRSSASHLDDPNAFSTGRLQIWTNTIGLIKDAPLTGYGWGQFILIQNQYPLPQVHNFPLELLLGLGIPMGTIVIVIVLTLWVRANRCAARGGPTTLTSLCLLNTMALYSLVSGTYYYGVPVVLTGLAWGICLSPSSPAGIQRSSDNTER